MRELADVLVSSDSCVPGNRVSGHILNAVCRAQVFSTSGSH